MTTGSNKKITYWATFDGQAIRMLDGAEEGDINTLAITRLNYLNFRIFFNLILKTILIVSNLRSILN